MKTLLLILTLAFSFEAFGQAECPPIALQDLKLGMSVAEAEKAIKQKITLNDNPDLADNGFTKARLLGTGNATAIMTEFYQGNLYEIHVIYNNSVKWNNMLDFTSTLSKTLNLQSKWTHSANTRNISASELKCGSYALTAARIDLTYSAVVNDLKISVLTRKSKQDQKENNFKP